MGYKNRRRVPLLRDARTAYGKHLIGCEHCLLGAPTTTTCIKGAARYAALCASLDAKFPQLLLADLRLSSLFGARLDFSGHVSRCKPWNRGRVPCEWCLELWSRVLAKMHPGD